MNERVYPPDYNAKPITVIILTPVHGPIEASMAASVAHAMLEFMATARDYPAEVKVGWQCLGGSNLAQQRQTLVSRAMNMKATHVLFWDSDIVAPPDCITRLLNRSQAMVVTNYPTKEVTSQPTVYLDGDDHTGPLWTKPGDTGLVKDVARAGLGLALVDAQVFDYLDLPWFHFKPAEPEFIMIGTEDHYFCDKVRGKGVPIVCDQDLSNEIAHIGRFEFTNQWAVKSEETRQAIYNGEVPDSEKQKEAAE